MSKKQLRQQLAERADIKITASGTVAVGYCYAQGTFTPQFARSYRMLLARELAAGRIVVEFPHETSGVHIPKARCDIVRSFLDHPTRPEWLLMVDSDATFSDDLLDRLLASAHPKHRPMIGALAFGVAPGKGADGEHTFNDVGGTNFELFPTLYVFDDEARPNMMFNYPREQLVHVHATGAHCMLIHRSVLANPGWLEDGHPLPWYRTAISNGNEVSEDQFFCWKAGSLGYPIFVDTSIKTGHVKTFVADEDEYDRRRGAATRVAAVPPPATERVAVLVPVMNRPQNVKPFMESLRASTGLATAYFIADRDDNAEIEAVNNAGDDARLIISDRGPTFAGKVNCGFKATTEPWVLVVGDDVRFHPGWLDHAMYAAQVTGKRVIGTNDLANKYVMAGQHATHPLFRRDYVDELGGSWDGPGLIAHEGYHHWFVDNEFCQAALDRDEFVVALASIVEHLHPTADKAPDDEVYKLGRSRRLEDEALYVSRREAHHASDR